MGGKEGCGKGQRDKGNFGGICGCWKIRNRWTKMHVIREPCLTLLSGTPEWNQVWSVHSFLAGSDEVFGFGLKCSKLKLVTEIFNCSI